jgi:hypothetical protein
VQPTYYLDALLTFYGPDERYSIGLWGKNLLDKRYISTVYDSPGYMGLVGYAPPAPVRGDRRRQVLKPSSLTPACAVCTSGRRRKPGTFFEGNTNGYPA